MKTTEELNTLLDELSKFDTKIPRSLDQLKNTAEKLGKSWSGSWIGYQSRIYYDSFTPVPAGAHFSIEWGGMDTFSNDTNGDWKEYDYDYVIEYIHQLADVTNIDKEEKECDNIEKELNNFKVKAKSILSVFLRKCNDDFVEEQSLKLQKIKIHSAKDFIKAIMPQNLWSRDSLAMSQGCKVPPHFDVIANVVSLKEHYSALKDFINILKLITTHIDRIEDDCAFSRAIGDKIFIGHGRSLLWMKLKDFIKDKLELPYEEFNRVPAAGVSNVARLQSMLDNAKFAFLVMTAEDEQKYGTVRARMNVIHEVGLFQGKLGFSHAIILLEEGCEEFSNIQGLGQIRFSKGKIESCFEEVRDVLLHHKIIEK